MIKKISKDQRCASRGATFHQNKRSKDAPIEVRPHGVSNGIPFSVASRVPMELASPSQFAMVDC